MEGGEEVKRPSQHGVGARIRLDSVKGFDSASRYIEEVKRYCHVLHGLTATPNE